MPHVSEFHATPDHDRHDSLLVAALAAGDLSGTDRDHAVELTRSCATCADLHDDLVAIARATASVPPPVPTRPRDFQLTPADVARLRSAGWRRFVAPLGRARWATSRPLGVGLATLGLVGLLIGNAPVLSLGGSTAAPAPPAAVTSLSAETSGGESTSGGAAQENVRGAVDAAASAAASNSAPYGAAFGPLSSAAPAVSQDTAGVPSQAASGAVRVSQADGPDTVKSAPTPASAAATMDGREAGESGPFRPLNVVFGLAVLVGLGLLVASRLRSRSTV